MAIEKINVGLAPNDSRGDPFRTSMEKANRNFQDLDARVSASSPVAVKVRGQLPSTDDLPAEGGPGDVWIISGDGWAWDGLQWNNTGPWQGPKGDSWRPDATGPLSGRSAYDAMPVPFSYLADDNGMVYFRRGAAGGWSLGQAFPGAGIANKPESVAGQRNDVLMTPEGTAEAIQAQAMPTRAQSEVQTPPAIQQIVRTSGYATDGDGGGATYKRVSSEPSHDGKFQAADGGWWEMSEVAIYPEMTGAKGDGITDDTAAIQAADGVAAAIGGQVVFSKGVYAANSLNQTSGWHMLPGARILYNGDVYGECVRLSASGTKSGTITIDLGGSEPFTGYYVSGDNNYIDYIDMYDCISTNKPWVVRGIYVVGHGNKVRDIALEDFVKVGNANDSSPQGYVTSGAAQANDVRNIHAVNCRSTVVNNSTGLNTYGRVVSHRAQDNGFYAVAGFSTVDEIVYDGDDNAIGFRSNANCSIGVVHLMRVGATSIFFGDCGDISIGDVFCHDLTQAVLHLNLANTGKITVASISGTLVDATPFAMSVGFGDVEFLTLGRVDLKLKLTSAGSINTRSVVRLDAAKGINLGSFNLDIILDGYVPTTPFYMRLNGALSKPSFIDSVRISLLQSDGLTPYSGQVFFCTGADVTGANTAALPQPNLRIGEGNINTSGWIAPYTSAGYVPGTLTTHGIPTVGYWRRGTMMWSQSPSSGAPAGWVCTASGTPGTWAALANLA